MTSKISRAASDHPSPPSRALRRVLIALIIGGLIVRRPVCAGRRQRAGLCVAMTLALLAIVATPASAETCPNEAFRQGPGADLPDCRAYELVTPPFKEAALAPLEAQFSVTGLAGMSVEGDHVAVVSTGNFGDAQGAGRGNSYELTRTESGWTEQDIDLPESAFPVDELSESELSRIASEPIEVYASAPLQASPDFGAFLYQSLGQEGGGSFWAREADGALHHFGPGTGTFIGASSDLSHVLFEAPNHGGLEEEDVAGGRPAPVGLGPGAGLCPAARAAGFGPSGMSANGSVVFFHVPAEGCSPGDPAVSEIFARIDAGEPGARTVAISEPSKADCEACDTAEAAQKAAPAEPEDIDGASADGSRVFFTTSQPLLGSTAETSANIYEYDFDAPSASSENPDGRIIRITSGEWGHEGAQVQGVVKVSEDGSHVYFVAAGRLEGASNQDGESPKEGESNLYVFQRDAKFPDGQLSFIAGRVSYVNPDERYSVTPGVGGASVTPDGRFLVFTSSTEGLTPDDTSTANQVFEYDAETGDLVRVSIGQNGFDDNGNTDVFSAFLPGQQGFSAEGPVAVSDDGEYVVFESPDGLTPGALNGALEEIRKNPYVSGYAENVYEYHDGNVYLISDGQGTSAVALRGMSPSGDDIFFETVDRLVPQDTDAQEVNLYDARIDGGFPAPVSELTSCTGDACQGQLSPAPTLLSPGSEFQAGGNPPLTASETAAKAKPKAKPKAKKPTKCRRGYVKKKGRCVKASRARKSSDPGRSR